jgi:hypothetical protein
VLKLEIEGSRLTQAGGALKSGHEPIYAPPILRCVYEKIENLERERERERDERGKRGEGLVVEASAGELEATG